MQMAARQQANAKSGSGRRHPAIQATILLSMIFDVCMIATPGKGIDDDCETRPGQRRVNIKWQLTFQCRRTTLPIRRGLITSPSLSLSLSLSLSILVLFVLFSYALTVAFTTVFFLPLSLLFPFSLSFTTVFFLSLSLYCSIVCFIYICFNTRSLHFNFVSHLRLCLSV